MKSNMFALLVVVASIASSGAVATDIAKYQELTVQISDSVPPTNCNQTLTKIEVRLIMFL